MATVTIDDTTITEPVTSTTQNSIVVASATGFAAGNIVFIDKEAMRIRSSYVSGTTIPVTRGILGTAAQLHQDNAPCYCGPAKEFYHTDVTGYANTDNEYALPHINVRTGNIYNIVGNQWVQWRNEGYGNDGTSMEHDYTTAGAITIAPGVHKVNGTTLAMTLANPGPEHNGIIMTVVADNASAHTLTVTDGFGAGGGGEDVATFSGVRGDSITLRACDSLWYIIGTHQVSVA